ncbi:MAG: hypothetical protein JO013_12220 [Alphaproteobacteria bacterium]|nr:hypothetical protein [Alphaproteobacteria bacterium]
MLICGLCALALVPAVPLVYVGFGWLDLRPPAQFSAAALVAMPLPLAAGAWFAWRAARSGKAWPLLAAAGCVLAFLGLFAVLSAWGGRMLI